MSEERKGNRLSRESSPYLLQHAKNPVDWYPWGEEAFEAARSADRPIFLSIGYSSCHWCHVMERESFEDPEVAGLMNEAFVNIKVDREERPDVDSLYMKVCQMMTGGGGWPLTVIMTPDRVPFWAGTYLPRTSRHGMTGMAELVRAVSKAWKEGRDEIKEVSVKVLEMLDSFERDPLEGDVSDLPSRTFEALKDEYEPRHGGFDGGRKFPSPHRLLFLLRHWREKREPEAREMALHTIDEIIKGGIRDHVGGGFHRYSTDPRWHLPHFEKMLYDQAFMLMALSEGYSASGKPEYMQAAVETIEYVASRMTSKEGGFYSSEDADAAGVEGSFYVWKYDELAYVLPKEDMALFKEIYDVWESGNYRDEATRMRSGKNVLHLPLFLSEYAEKKGRDPAELAAWDELIRRRLRAIRNARPAPPLDDKVMADWNGAMVAALCLAHRHLGSEKALDMARAALDFADRKMVLDGTLHHVYREGEARVPSFLDDHAYLAWANLEMYFETTEGRYLERCLGLVEEMIGAFTDKEEGGFYLSREDPSLLVRIKDLHDGAMPSGNSVAYYVLSQLNALFADARMAGIMEGLETHFLRELRLSPSSYCMFVNGVMMKIEARMLEVFGGEKVRLPGYHPHLLVVMAEHLEPGAVPRQKAYRLCLRGRCLPETDDLKVIEGHLQ